MAIIVSAIDIVKAIEVAKANEAANAANATKAKAKANATKANATKANAAAKENQRPCCGCYKEDSTDTRCCGLCYYCCPAKHIDKEIDKKRCDCCPNDFCEYWYSGLVQTTAGYGNKEEDINGICCCFCFPVKFPLFFPCFLGSLCNHTINKFCATTCCTTYCGARGCSAPIKRNYLF